MEIKRANVCDYISGGKSAGFVKLSRRFFLLKEWQERRVLSSAEALLDLILLTDNKEQAVEISFRQLADRWGWTLGKVQRFFRSTNIRCDTLNDTPSDTPKTLNINADSNVTDTPSDTLTDTNLKRKDINEKENFPPHPLYKEKDNYKEKEVRIPPLTPPEGVGDEDEVFIAKYYSKFDFSFVDEKLRHQLIVWLRYKHDEHKFTYKTQSSIEVCYKGLKTKSSGNPDIAAAIVEQSVENGWKGLFAIKKNYYHDEQRKETTEERNRRIIAETAAVIANRQAEDDRHREALRRP